MGSASTDQVPNLLAADGTINQSQWGPVITKAKDYLTFDANSSSSGTSLQFFDFAFTSTANTADFQTASDVLQDNHSGLLLGLDTTKSTNFQQSLSNVLTTFGIPNLGSGTLSKIVSEVEKTGQLTIASSSTDLYRNGLWIFPQDASTLQIAVRLSFSPSQVNFTDNDFMSTLASALTNDFSIKVPTLNIPPTDLIMIFTSITNWTASGMTSTSNYSLTVKLPEIGGKFDFYVSLDNFTQNKEETILALKQTPSFLATPSNAIQSVSSFSGSGMPSSTDDAVPQWDSLFSAIFLWYVDVDVTDKAWDVAIIVNIPISANNPLPIFLKYNSSKKTFSGGVWTNQGVNASNNVAPGLPIDNDSGLLLPTYQEYHGLPSGFSTPPPPFVDLNRVLDLTLPAGLPTNLIQGTVFYNANDNTTGKTLQVELIFEPPPHTDPSNVPTPFTWVDAQFQYSKTSTPDATTLDIVSDFQLNPPAGSTIQPATMKVDLKYSNDAQNGKHWSLTGDVDALNFALLSQFADPGLMSVMQNVVLTNVHVEYSYKNSSSSQTGGSTTSPSASAFLFTGEIDLTNQTTGKGLKLDMYYQYANNADAAKQLISDLSTRTPPITPPSGLAPPSTDGTTAAWAFDAFLSPLTDTGNATLGDVIDAIAVNTLPSFIKSIPLSNTGGQNVVTLKAHKDVLDGNEVVVFLFDVSLGILEFTFVQVSSNAAPSSGGNSGSHSDASNSTTRILRLSVGELPLFSSLPVIKELPQPYQLLTYCWANQDVPKKQLDSLNTEYLSASPFYYKNTDKDQTTALKQGHHFIVVNNNACVLDHIFTTDTAPNPSSQSGTGGGVKKAVTVRKPLVHERDTTTPTDDATNPPTTGTLKKDSSFLSISGVGLQYSQGTLWLFLDASIKLGPIEMDLIGFGIGLKLIGDGAINLSNLSNLSSDAAALEKALSFQLHGLSMDFNQPPVLIAGVFEHIVTATLDAYRGGIAVGVDPYDFVAVGEYAEVTENNNTYKSIFIYAKLDGPLIDLEIAIIEGVRLGFGYNSFVRTPTVQQLAQFPFISDSGVSGAGTDPMAILTAMRGGDNPWVQVKQDSYWFVFGLSVAAFDILTATAVALLEFTSQGVVVSIFADVIGQMPPSTPRSDCIVYVELLMNAELNFIYDYFFVQAALAPTSFLLVPECHLSGGYAMGTWFGTSDYAGDWVYTIGGYHRQFQPPSYYPQPDRLQISFQIGDNMSLVGQGYFAITPKAVMGGCAIYIQLSVGPVSAHLNCAFDAIVQFHPLYYIVDFGVDIGVSCHVHILFISFDISIDIGADLHIEGPSFGGKAHVDFWFFGFDVYFGASPSPPPPISLEAFYGVLQKAGPPADPPADDSTSTSYDIQLKYALGDGAFPATPAPTPAGTTAPFPSSGQTTPWRVRASFAFRISSVFAISSATIIGETAAADAQVPANVAANQTITSIPMQVTAPIQSPLDIVVTFLDGPSNDNLISGWQASFVVKDVPIAMWGDPNHPPDPLNPLQKGTVPLQMAVDITSPPPLLSKSKIPPVNATDISRLHVTPDHELQPTETQTTMLPATLDKTPSTWPAMATAWESAAQTNRAVAADLAAACMSALFWDQPAPDVAQKARGMNPKPWVLNSAFPTRLVAGTGQKDVGDGLANTYLALPRVVAV